MAIKKTKTYLFKLFIAGILLLATSLSFVGCDKDKAPVETPNPGGPGGSQIVEVQTTVEGLVTEYIQDNHLENAIQNENKECLEELVSSIVENLDTESFKAFIKDDTAVAVYKHADENGITRLGSTTFDLSTILQYYLGTDLEDLILFESGEFGDTTVSTSLSDKYNQKFATAMDKMLNNINTTQYTASQTNSYVEDSDIPASVKNQVLKYLEESGHDKLGEPVVFGAPRKDGSAIVVGVNQKGEIVEYCFNIEGGYNMIPPAYYNEVGSGASEVTSRKLDASSAYVEPGLVYPQKETVQVSDLYDKAFQGFEFKDLGGLMNDLAKREMGSNNPNVLFAEFDSTKTEISLYAEYTDTVNKIRLLKLTFKSDFGDIVKNIWDYQEFKDMTDEEIKQYVLGALNITETEVEKDSADQTEIEGDLAKERQRLESLGNDIQDDSKLKLVNRVFVENGGGEKLDNVNEYGKKLLEDEKDIEVLRTYLGAWGGRVFDTGKDFTQYNTGYAQWCDACVVYVKDGKIYIYKTDVGVPDYTDSTNETRYSSILSGKYAIRQEETQTINNAIIFDEGGASSTAEDNYIGYMVDLFLEDRR